MKMNSNVHEKRDKLFNVIKHPLVREGTQKIFQLIEYQSFRSLSKFSVLFNVFSLYVNAILVKFTYVCIINMFVMASQIITGDTDVFQFYGQQTVQFVTSYLLELPIKYTHVFQLIVVLQRKRIVIHRNLWGTIYTSDPESFQ